MSTTQKVLKSSPMMITFQTTLNNRNYKGTVNVNDAQIYKQDGTKYSPSY